MKIVVVIQACTGSPVLPGKVLLPAAGAPLLARMISRVRAARIPDAVVVATTPAAADDPIFDIAQAAGIDVVRGHPTDELDRYRYAARVTKADVVVKIPSNCPLIDPATIDRMIAAFLAHAELGPVDYVSNLHPATWPAGFDVEVMTWRALWDSPASLRVRNVCLDGGFDYSDRYRLALEYAEDYALIKRVYDELWSPQRHFTLSDILDVVEDIRVLPNAKHLRAA